MSFSTRSAMWRRETKKNMNLWREHEEKALIHLFIQQNVLQNYDVGSIVKFRQQEGKE